MKNRLIKGDCLEVMDLMIEKKFKVDHIITDPPYNIAKDNNFHTMGRAGIDFGEWDKGFDQLAWIDRAYDLIENGGSLFIFNDWKNVGEIAKYAESKGFIIKDMIRWKKANPMPRNRDRRYITDFEVAVWLVKPNAKWIFNRLSDTYDRCEYEYPLVSQSERVGHTTQKPIALMEEIIRRHTNEGQLILDPFAGSSSTAIAAINTDRKYICIEKEDEYHKMSETRINKHLSDILESGVL